MYNKLKFTNEISNDSSLPLAFTNNLSLSRFSWLNTIWKLFPTQNIFFHNFMYRKDFFFLENFIFMPPTSPKLTGHIGFGLSVRSCVRLCVRSNYACHILWTVLARVLKFHIWILHGRIADTRLFSCPSYLPFWSYAPLKKSEWNLMHAISWEPCMLGFETSFIDFSWKNSWPVSFSCPSYHPFWSYAALKKSEWILSARYHKKYLN